MLNRLEGARGATGKRIALGLLMVLLAFGSLALYFLRLGPYLGGGFTSENQNINIQSLKASHSTRATLSVPGNRSARFSIEVLFLILLAPAPRPALSCFCSSSKID